MNVEFGFLARDASVGDGTFNVTDGGMDTLTVDNFSCAVTLAMALGVSVNPSECGRPFALEIQLWDEDGGQQMTPEKRIFTPSQRVDQPLALSVLFCAVKCHLVLRKPGAYAFRVLLNGEERKVVPLYALKGQSPQVT